MPRRLIPLINGEYYHVFNRAINKQTIFLNVKSYKRAQEVMRFYSFSNSKPRYSKFVLLSNEEKNRIWKLLKDENKKLVDIISYSFMPNHYHFLIRQLKENGISKFIKEFQNSYTKYFNIKNKMFGPILQGQFKALRINNDYQLLHLSRYIHLNPYTSFVAKDLEDLNNYPWSSFGEYIGKPVKNICNKDIILSQFKSIKEYKKFVIDRASYQRELGLIKHLTLEE